MDEEEGVRVKRQAKGKKVEKGKKKKREREMGLMRNEEKGATHSEWSSGDLALGTSNSFVFL
jgi:hypothetical protein